MGFRAFLWGRKSKMFQGEGNSFSGCFFEEKTEKFGLKTILKYQKIKNIQILTCYFCKVFENFRRLEYSRTEEPAIQNAFLKGSLKSFLIMRCSLLTHLKLDENEITS